MAKNQVDLNIIRNFGIIAHIDAGKTTCSERMLYHAGKTHRIGDIDDGTTVLDYLEEERDRGITIISAAATLLWNDHHLHLIDTPGHIDFTVEVERSLRVIDGAIVIFSAVEGVEAQSETVWHQANQYKVPRMAFINKLDRMGADFERVVGEIQQKFGDVGLPIQAPVGIENQFNSVIDLIRMKQLFFEGNDGAEIRAEEIPADLKDYAEEKRMEMLEHFANFSDEIAELYLAEEEITEEFFMSELKRCVQANEVVPIFAGSAKKNIGIQPLLNSVIDILPSPLEAHSTEAELVRDHSKLNIDPVEHKEFSGLIFKVKASTTADLYYMRTYSGKIKANDSMFIPRLNSVVRIKRLLRLYADQQEAIEEAGAGDIVAFTGPKNLLTGDTVCEKKNAVILESMQFPEPVISMALEAKSTKDNDRLDEILDLLTREDPTLGSSRDENTGQRILSGMGELHLEVTIRRIQTDYKLEVKCGEPRVAYRETLSAALEHEVVFEKVMGEQEFFAGLKLNIKPVANNEPPITIKNKLKGDVPKHYQEVGSQAVRDAFKTGGNFGYPLINLEIELMGLKSEGEKTTDGAIVGAALQLVNEVILKQGTIMLEPIMKLDIVCPESHVGEVSNYIQQKRGLVQNVADQMELKKVMAQVPLAEMFGFSKSLPKITGGRGSFAMEPFGYQPVEQ